MMFLISRTAGHGLMDLFKRTLCFSAESTCVFYSCKATLPLVPITTISILFRGGGSTPAPGTIFTPTPSKKNLICWMVYCIHQMFQISRIQSPRVCILLPLLHLSVQ